MVYPESPLVNSTSIALRIALLSLRLHQENLKKLRLRDKTETQKRYSALSPCLMREHGNYCALIS